ESLPPASSASRNSHGSTRSATPLAPSRRDARAAGDGRAEHAADGGFAVRAAAWPPRWPDERALAVSGAGLRRSAGRRAAGTTTSYIPPDTAGAVGPTRLLSALNSNYVIQDRSGAVLGTVSMSTFWASVGAFNPFDPRV